MILFRLLLISGVFCGLVTPRSEVHAYEKASITIKNFDVEVMGEHLLHPGIFKGCKQYKPRSYELYSESIAASQVNLNVSKPGWVYLVVQWRRSLVFPDKYKKYQKDVLREKDLLDQNWIFLGNTPWHANRKLYAKYLPKGEYSFRTGLSTAPDIIAGPELDLKSPDSWEWLTQRGVGGILASQIVPMFQMESWDRLNDYIRKIRKHSPGPHGLDLCKLIYNELAKQVDLKNEQEVEDFLKTLKLWRKHSPNFSGADLCEVQFRMKYAWHIRGNGFSFKVDPDAWPKFYGQLDLAEEILNHCNAQSIDDTAWYSYKMSLLCYNGFKGEEAVFSLLTQARDRQKATLSLCFSALYCFTGKWHGSDDLLPEKTEQITELCYELFGEDLYWYLYVNVYTNIKRSTAISLPFDWDRAKKSMKSWINKRPNSTWVHFAAIMSIKHQDRSTAEWCFARIGLDEEEHSPAWGREFFYFDSYRRCFYKPNQKSDHQKQFDVFQIGIPRDCLIEPDGKSVFVQFFTNSAQLQLSSGNLKRLDSILEKDEVERESLRGLKRQHRILHTPYPDFKVIVGRNGFYLWDHKESIATQHLLQDRQFLIDTDIVRSHPFKPLVYAIRRSSPDLVSLDLSTFDTKTIHSDEKIESSHLLALSHECDFLYMLSSKGLLEKYSLQSNRTVNQIKLPVAKLDTYPPNFPSDTISKFSDNGRYMVIYSPTANNVGLYIIETEFMKMLHYLPLTKYTKIKGVAKSIAISNDAKVVVFGLDSGDQYPPLGNHLWIPGAGKGAPKIHGCYEFNDIEFLPNSYTIVTTSKDMTVRTWDLEHLAKSKVNIDLKLHDPLANKK